MATGIINCTKVNSGNRVDPDDSEKLLFTYLRRSLDLGVYGETITYNVDDTVKFTADDAIANAEFYVDDDGYKPVCIGRILVPSEFGLVLFNSTTTGTGTAITIRCLKKLTLANGESSEMTFDILYARSDFVS